MTKQGALWAGLAMLLSGCGGPDFTTAATTREASNGAAGAAIGAPAVVAPPTDGGGPSPASGGSSSVTTVGGSGGASTSAGGAVAAGGTGFGGTPASAGGAPDTSAGGYVGPSTGGIPHIGLGGGGIGGAAGETGLGGAATGGQRAGGAGGSTIPSICDTGDLCVTGRHCGTVQCLPSGATIDCSQYVVCDYSEYCAGTGGSAVCQSYFEGLGCNGPGSGPIHVCLVDTASATGCDDCQKEPIGRPGCAKTAANTWRCASFLATP